MAKPAEQPPSDMEVDAAQEEKQPVRFSINVLELMREAQMQHGLRQSDYTRYRFVISTAFPPDSVRSLPRSARLVPLSSSTPFRYLPLSQM
ncbi:hypothetical protein PR202_gb29316 [Eleusine coracana subsp. coracana]|uniref:Uncharacterized protein n=1 Tax=Eleusine coracana subsp. coracana TaxID=191504 RepID=A0AAV5G112_ELECO|nr:hypothetical protein PR202_gb29316 [Eleusine coracana subsp. coracana]